MVRAIADWDLAARVAWSVASRRPVRASRTEVAQLREDVQRIAVRADGLSRAATGLGTQLPPAEVVVIGRRRWIRNNVESLSWLLDPVSERLMHRGQVASAMTRRTLGLQVGVVLGFLATKVLGQYEVFLPGGRTPGRLLLVGPNLLDVERRVLPPVGVAAAEFRLGVVLHELAHRLQFEAVPWMRPHLQGIVDRYLAEARFDPERMREAAARIRKLLQDPSALTDAAKLAEVVLTPEQAVHIKQAQSLMSLLEGHGNVVMDWGAELTGGELDPTRVRTALNERRNTSTGVDGLLRRMLGVSMKARQYEVGEKFILAVADGHGRELFARVWDDPAHLPTEDELADPDSWAWRIAQAA